MLKLVILLLVLSTKGATYKDVQFTKVEPYRWQLVDKTQGFRLICLVNKKDFDNKNFPTRFSPQFYSSLPGWAPIRIDCYAIPPLRDDPDFYNWHIISYNKQGENNHNRAICEHFSVIDPPEQISIVLWFHTVDTKWFNNGRVPTLQEANNSMFVRLHYWYEKNDEINFKRFRRDVDKIKTKDMFKNTTEPIDRAVRGWVLTKPYSITIYKDLSNKKEVINRIEELKFKYKIEAEIVEVEQ